MPSQMSFEKKADGDKVAKVRQSKIEEVCAGLPGRRRFSKQTDHKAVPLSLDPVTVPELVLPYGKLTDETAAVTDDYTHADSSCELAQVQLVVDGEAEEQRIEPATSEEPLTPDGLEQMLGF